MRGEPPGQDSGPAGSMVPPSDSPSAEIRLADLLLGPRCMCVQGPDQRHQHGLSCVELVA